MGLRAPSYTQAPNELFDEWLPQLEFVELKLLMVILRKTFGWHKVSDRISLTQLEKLTGSQRKALIKASKKLEEMGLIRRIVVGEKGSQNTYYELVVQDSSNNLYQCPQDTPPSVLRTPTKETLTKETKKEAASCFKRNAAAPSFEDQIKKSIKKEEQEAALKYVKANPEKFKSARNPIGLLVKIVNDGDHRKSMKDPEVIQRRRHWASVNEWSMGGGSACAAKEGYVKISGSSQKVYKWDSNDKFWDDLGLGFD